MSCRPTLSLVIALDFSLEFAGFFPRKKSGENPVKRRENPVPPRKNPVKYTKKIPRYSAPKWHSSLFLRTFYVGIRTFPRPPARPGPGPIPARPAIAARRPRPSRPAAANQFGTCDRIFPSREGTRKKMGTKRENSLTALKQPCPPRRAAPRSTSCCAQASFLAAACCMYTMCISHSNCLKSQYTSSP